MSFVVPDEHKSLAIEAFKQEAIRRRALADRLIRKPEPGISAQEIVELQRTAIALEDLANGVATVQSVDLRLMNTSGHPSRQLVSVPNADSDNGRSLADDLIDLGRRQIDFCLGVQTLRKNQGFSGPTLAKKSGVSQSQISRFERGVMLPSDEWLLNLLMVMELEDQQVVDLVTELQEIRHEKSLVNPSSDQKESVGG